MFQRSRLYLLKILRQNCSSVAGKINLIHNSIAANRFHSLSRLYTSVGIVICLTSAVGAVKYSVECENNGGKDQTNALLIEDLNKKLKSARNNLSKLNKPTPELLVTFSNEVIEIKFELDNNVNIGALLSHWLLILMKSDNSSVSKHPLSYRFDNNEVQVISYDGKSQIVWRFDYPGTCVSIKKYHGFTNGELDLVVKGYEELLKSYYTVAPDIQQEHDRRLQSGKFFHASQRLKSPVDKALEEFFAGSHGAFERRILSHGGMTSRDAATHGRDTKPGGGTPTAIEKLEKLGIKVYTNPEGNPSSKDGSSVHSSGLSWDDLAGYSDVKRLIEDAVIAAYLHGDVYDDIVRKTRVTFESNRPSAILLEGPPGTG